MAAVFEEERKALGPLPASVYESYQEGRRRVQRDSFMEVAKAYIVSYLQKIYDIHSFLKSFSNLKGSNNLIQYEFIEQDLKMDLPYRFFNQKDMAPCVCGIVHSISFTNRREHRF